ncbi:MAG: YdeI/OmpD-associated family protein, partial [Chloroflexota bacterium]
SRQRTLVDPVANAKTAETRDRNIAKALTSLRGKRS